MSYCSSVEGLLKLVRAYYTRFGKADRMDTVYSAPWNATISHNWGFFHGNPLEMHSVFFPFVTFPSFLSFWRGAL